MALTVPDERGRVSERQLVARVVDGDPAAQRELYDSHVDRVYRLAYRLAGEDELARDFTLRLTETVDAVCVAVCF